MSAAARRIGELRAANGWRWTAWYVVRAALRRAQEGTERRLAVLEGRRGLPGANAVAENVRRWNEHDWRQLGEEWTVSRDVRAYGDMITAFARKIAPSAWVLAPLLGA